MKPAIIVPDFISTLELAGIKRDRRKIDALRAQMEALGADVEARVEGIIAAIEAGVPIDGEARILTRRRQNISWLSIVKRELGERTIEAIKNEWPISYYKALQIA